MRLLPLLLIFLSGMGLSLQAAMNARLRAGLGSPVAGAAVSFLVGLALLAILVALNIGGRTYWRGLADAPWWAWLGGLMGALYVAYVIIAVKQIGAGATIATSMVGQLLMALLLDAFGWLGIEPKPITAQKVIGAVLLVVGIVLMQWPGKR